MIDNLILTQNAQFYLSKNPITNDIIDEIFDAASDNIKNGAVFICNEMRNERTTGEPGFTYKYSIRIYPSEREVFFLEPTELQDIIHSYLLLLEIDGNIAVFKKSTANINDVLQDNFDVVDHLKLINTFNDEDVEFQKLALRNMTVSERAVRIKSYEAVDLKGVLSVHAAGRSIPYFLRIRQGDSLKSITTTTGRIVESAERKGIDDIAIWARQQITGLINQTGNKSFLDAFASPVAIKDVLSETRPIAILIEASALLDRIFRDSLVLKRERKAGGTVGVSQRFIDVLIKKLERVYELDATGNVTNGPLNSKIRINDKTITFNSRQLRKIFISDKGKDITLQSYIIKYGLYSICFANPKYMYFMGNCFEDRSGVSEIDSILGMLVIQPDLNTATSEKGVINPTKNDFDATSVFKIIENIHRNDNYIFCDDLGNEWADHITFNLDDSCISFIHSKHGEESTSASNLHDVVGQGIKNLGNMFFAMDMFIRKKNNKITRKYSGTQIPTMRKGTYAGLKADLPNVLGNYKLIRKCILSCTFLSKAGIVTEFNKIKGGVAVSGHVIQLLWILSSFAHASQEMSVVPIIYCRP